MTVEELIEKLREIPGHYPVMVEVIVGGDLVTDDVDLEQVELAGLYSTYARLRPAPDAYGTRELIDQALEGREWAEVLAGEIEDPRTQRPGMQRRREWASRLRRVGA